MANCGLQSRLEFQGQIASDIDLGQSLISLADMSRWRGLSPLPVLVFLGAPVPPLRLSVPLSQGLILLGSVDSPPPLTILFLKVSPSLSSRMGRVTVCSSLFHRLPPDRLAVLSSPVPVSRASICSSPFLGSSPILWLLPRRRKEPHLTNHDPGLPLGPLSLRIFQRPGALYLRPLSRISVPMSLDLSPPSLGHCPVPPSPRASAPCLILFLSPWVSVPFSLGLSLPLASLMLFLSLCPPPHPHPLLGLSTPLHPSPRSLSPGLCWPSKYPICHHSLNP